MVRRGGLAKMAEPGEKGMAGWVGKVHAQVESVGAHVNAKSGQDDTALGQAFFKGNVAIVELLREHGAVGVERSSSRSWWS